FRRPHLNRTAPTKVRSGRCLRCLGSCGSSGGLLRRPLPPGLDDLRFIQSLVLRLHLLLFSFLFSSSPREATVDAVGDTAAIPVGLSQVGVEEILDVLNFLGGAIRRSAGGHIALENIAEIQGGELVDTREAVAIQEFGWLSLRRGIFCRNRLHKEQKEE